MHFINLSDQMHVKNGESPEKPVIEKIYALSIDCFILKKSESCDLDIRCRIERVVSVCCAQTTS